MNHKPVKVILYSKIKYNKIFLNDSPYKWLFFGVSAEKKEFIKNQDTNKNQFFFADELHDISLKYKDYFTDFMAKVNKINFSDQWWAANICSRNPANTNLYLYFCYILLFQKILNTNEDKFIFIIENPFLYKLIYVNFKSNIKVDIKLEFLEETLFYFKNKCFFFLKILTYFLNAFISKISSHFYLKKNLSSDMQNCKIFTCTWFLDNSFKNNLFADSYLKELYPFLKKNKKDVVSIPLNFCGKNIIKKCKGLENVLCTSKYISFYEVIKTSFQSIFFKIILTKEMTFEGLDLSLLIFIEDLESRQTVFYPMLQYKAFLNIFKVYSPKVVVFPYENLSFERMIILAAQKNKIKTLGYQHTSVPFLLLNYFIGKEEQNILPQPDFIITNGAQWKNVIDKAGFSSQLQNGGSLRFTQSQKIVSKFNLSQKENLQENILVTLPGMLNYSLDLIFYILKNNIENKIFYIKPHPNFKISDFGKYVDMNLLPKNIIFTSKPLSEIFSQVKYCVYTSSSSGLECIENGIIVYKFLPERIDLDPLLNCDFIHFKQVILFENNLLKLEYILPEFENEINLMSEEFNEQVWKTLLFDV